ncbi:MAG TPA: Crp/Fnr family transcriptional regulator [Candidatus Dorea stercoravium]|nr:Crp/Fnr family transcriptional regulator [Candidatus Dorea stercoravium]
MEKVLSCLSTKMQEYERGSVLFRQGEKMEQMGIVLEGSLSLEKEDFWGNRSILAVVEAGEVFGEVYACRKERTLNINVTAQYRTKVLLLDLTPVLDRGEGEGPGKEKALYEKLTVNLVHILADKTWSMARKTEYLSGRGIREKVEAYLSAQAQMAGGGDFIIPFNRQELADFLAVDRSALSRELGKMRREGILDYRKDHFRLLAADRLPD